MMMTMRRIGGGTDMIRKDVVGNIICQKCGHAALLHCGPDRICEVRRLESGYGSFAELPRCGCKLETENEDNQT